MLTNGTISLSRHSPSKVSSPSDVSEDEAIELSLLEVLDSAMFVIVMSLHTSDVSRHGIINRSVYGGVTQEPQNTKFNVKINGSKSS